jgi:uracil-DNA glycosylase
MEYWTILAPRNGCARTKTKILTRERVLTRDALILYTALMEVTIDSSWKEKLHDEFNEPYFADLTTFVKQEYVKGNTYPNPKNIFRAFDLCPFDKVKVIILGQDPYHGKGQANGLCFGVDEQVALPPSLKNIFKEIESDLGASIANRSGDLSRWARQGVLLLNSTLTVSAGEPGSHQGKGWEQFTDAVITKLSQEREHLVFILWGNYAKAKGAHIDRSRHYVIESPHPSPFSAYNGFFGSKPFSKTNEYLQKQKQEPINWL